MRWGIGKVYFGTKPSKVLGGHCHEVRLGCTTHNPSGVRTLFQTVGQQEAEAVVDRRHCQKTIDELLAVVVS